MKEEKLLCLARLSSWRTANKTAVDCAFVSQCLSVQAGAQGDDFSGGCKEQHMLLAGDPGGDTPSLLSAWIQLH